MSSWDVEESMRRSWLKDQRRPQTDELGALNSFAKCLRLAGGDPEAAAVALKKDDRDAYVYLGEHHTIEEAVELVSMLRLNGSGIGLDPTWAISQPEEED